MRKGQAEGKREATRLAAIERLGAARREVNGVLQGLVDDARAAFSTELCMVNLVLADVQYFRAWSGELPEDLARARQDPRERSMCRYVVENEAPFVVEDFLATEEFREQYFRVKYGVRFYAGAPLVTSDGHVLGSLCLIDTRPREFGEGGLAELQALARAVVARLETLGALQRERAAREEEARRGRELERLARQQERILVSAGEGIVGLDPGGKIGFANPAAAAMLGYETGEMVGRNMHHLVHHTRPDGTPYPLEECPNYLAFREGDTRRTDGEVFWRRDGTAFPVEYASSPVIEGGDVRGAVVTFSDVRERKVAEEALKESEERFRTLTDAALEALVISERGRILEVNRAFTEIFGYEPSEIVGADSLACIAPESREPVRENLLSGHDRPYEAVGLRKNGERFEAEIRGKASAYRGRAVRITAVRDITERKRAEEALKRSEERFRSLVQNASDLITVLEADGTVLYESPALEPMLGYAPEDFVGRNNYDLIHPDDAPRVLRAFARLSEERGANPYVEYRFRHADGSWRHLESGGVNLLDEPGVGGIVVNTRDITERKTLEERLLHQALHDPLTGLANRALLLDRLGHALDRAERTEACVAALFLDLDDFKVVNDSLGHDAGDELLVEAAERLGSCLRPEDTIARLGGDEFVVLLEDVHGRGEATEAATRIAEALREPFLLGAHEEAFVSVSIGVALASGGEDRTGSSPDDLLRRADVAMYEAKRKGKAHHAVFDLGMDARALERLRLGADLRRAVERGEFRVRYQPEVELSTGRIVGFEALVRWEHPKQGLVSPARFIPVAEETGLIVPIGRWILEEACRRAKEWREGRPNGPPLAMSVNLSARQFAHPDLARDVARALGESGLDPGCLILEITESVLMEDAPSTIDTLGELKALGVGIAVDDFGTGYSSLAYLRRFPVDYLKVDRSFVADLGEAPDDTVLVSGIVDLAHALGLSVVAEGVETEGQLGMLRGMGCELAQGFHFARPMPGEEAGVLLEKARLP